MTELLHGDLSEKIIGSAMHVLNVLRPGLDEKLYERALIIELRKRGCLVEQQKQFPVQYEEQPIGTLIPDIIVDGRIIVDAKVATSFNDSHLSQMIGYLAICQLELGLLLNFKFAKLQWKRVVKQS